MRNDLTEIVVVMDRSGSMSACQSDAEGGLNTFIKEQKELPGEALFTLVQFDTEYEFVHKAVPIKDVPKCHLVPRGWTALLDAVGRAINETGDRLRKMKEKDRPGLVCFVIITDGYENSSKEFTKAKIKSMIEHQQDKYNWKFSFLGANQDAFAEAASYGISRDSTSSWLDKCVGGALVAASANTTSLRAAAAAGKDMKTCGFNYSDAQRKAMNTIERTKG